MKIAGQPFWEADAVNNHSVLVNATDCLLSALFSLHVSTNLCKMLFWANWPQLLNS